MLYERNEGKRKLPILMNEQNFVEDSADALAYARRAIHSIESGKTPFDWAPFKSKDYTLAYLTGQNPDFEAKGDDRNIAGFRRIRISG